MSDTIDVHEPELVGLRGTASTSPIVASTVTGGETSDLQMVESMSFSPKISTLNDVVSLLNDSDAANIPEFLSKAAGFLKEPSKMASVIEQLLSNFIMDKVGSIGLTDELYDTSKQNFMPKCVNKVLSTLSEKCASIDIIPRLMSGDFEDPVSLIESGVSDFIDDFLQKAV